MIDLNNYLETVVQTKVDQAMAAVQTSWEQKSQEFFEKFDKKIKAFEKHSQELRISFEQNLSNKIDHMFKLKMEEINSNVKEEIDKRYQVAKEMLSKKEYKTTNDVEEALMAKLDEKLEAKTEELSVTFQAQIIKELEQVMAVIQQLLNNGLDLDKNIERELTVKLHEYMENNKTELQKIIKDELKSKLQHALDNLTI